MKSNYILLTFIATFCISFLLNAQLNVSPIFSDNMVLQQQTSAPIWGESKANQKVEIITSWDSKKYQLTADANGGWKTTLTTPIAGGPYSISIATDRKNKIQLNNVYVGEVWLCSGQSNMEWRVRNNILNYEQEIASANYPQVRMITIEKQTNSQPSKKYTAEGNGWKVCSPVTVADFSAVAYFFGREVYRSLNVPVGLINTSWGGTLAEAWADDKSLEEMPYFREYIQNMRLLPQDEVGKEALFQQQYTQWLSKLNQLDAGYANNQPAWAATNYQDAEWAKFSLPGMIQDQGVSSKNGVFWFRKEVQIPTAWAGQELSLNLGSVDDNDFTYFNGQQIGYTEGWMSNRAYKVPAKLAKAGKAVITVRVIDTGGLGGFGGQSENIVLQCKNDKIPLAGEWKVKLALSVGELPAIPARIDGNPNQPTVLYNGMIHPLVPYAIKGAIWYQGESNAGRAYQYRDLLPLMIHGWREKFGHNFPFYIVQLANHMKIQEQPSESSWAELREAQLKTLHLENTGLAVTIDIGEANDIHPRNKQDVGKRLALAALAKTYHQDIVYSGPIYRSHSIEGNKMRISFEHAKGLKTKDGDKVTGFGIAGADHQFQWADAIIIGDEVLVSSPAVAFPVAVRYAWADNPICNLYNGANLPASPFRTDDWDGLTR